MRTEVDRGVVSKDASLEFDVAHVEPNDFEILPLKVAEERALVMLDAIPLCVTFWDDQCNGIDCSSEAMNLFGLASKQEYFERFFDLSPALQADGVSSRDLVKNMVHKAFREGRCQFDWMHQTLSGEPIPAKITLVRVPYRRGQVVVGYTCDLREQKTKMREIRQTQADLCEARDRAEREAVKKANFLARMSHEIRTPMNAIIGMTEIAKMSSDTEKMKQCLETISDASNHLLGVINDILDISKIDSGKFSLSKSDFSIKHLVDRVLDVMAFKTNEKRHNLVIDISDVVPPVVSGDEQRLAQVVTNLLSNAVKFTDEGGTIHLTVAVDKDLQQGGHLLRFSVADTGIGISPEQQKVLFGMFEQGDASISKRFGGTGLGLAISKDIVEMMGGTIWVESALDQGSTFFFTVMLASGSGAHSEQEAQIKPASTEHVSKNLAFKRILLVEDIEVNREVTIALLSNTKIEIECAENGKVALALFQKNPKAYDAIFMDIHMPVMDGYQAAREIRALPAHRAHPIPIIAMTASVLKEDIEHCFEAGMDDHVGKPVKREDLLAVLEKHVL